MIYDLCLCLPLCYLCINFLLNRFLHELYNCWWGLSRRRAGDQSFHWFVLTNSKKEWDYVVRRHKPIGGVYNYRILSILDMQSRKGNIVTSIMLEPILMNDYVVPVYPFNQIFIIMPYWLIVQCWFWPAKTSSGLP